MTAFLLEWKKYFTFAALLSCFVNILQLTFPFYMFTIYRNIVVSYSPFSLANITVAACFAILALGLFSYLRSRLLAAAGRTLELKLRSGVYSIMVKGGAQNNRQAYRGGINDLATLRGFFSSPAVYALFDAVWAPFYLGLIFLFHPVLGLTAATGAGVMVGLSALQEYLVRRSMTEANRINTRNQRFVDSFLRNAEVINGMGMIRAISGRFITANNRVMVNQTRSSYYAGAIQAVIKPLQNVIQVLIYSFGAILAMRQGFDIGLMVAASIIMGRGLAPLMQLMSSWRMVSGAREAYARLNDCSAILDHRARYRPMPLPAPEGRVSVAGAVYLIDGHALIKGVSFELQPGELLGIIGPSGAGKTTLCRLLLGILTPAAGRVTLDGKDVSSWSKEEAGPHIGYLPQEVELFPGSVAENIARLNTPDIEALERAVEMSGLSPLVETLPEGLDTRVEGEEGIRLSGGQRQRIGLARALYGDPSLLVLDEPTSNLDEQGETLFVRALEALKTAGKCTCIMVTHKPALLNPMDKVLVLHVGTVALFGPKDEVFSRLQGAGS